LIAEHSVEDDQQLAHACSKRNLGFLACCEQSRVKGLHHWIAATGGQGTHVEHSPNLRPAAPNRPCAAQFAAIVVEGRNPHQRRDRAAIERPEFRHMRERGGDRDVANPGHTPEQAGLCTPRRRAADRVLQNNVELA